jgi:hypothetical protein
MKLFTLFILSFFIYSVPVLATQVGDVAHYKLDRSRDRTKGVQGGNIKMQVLAETNAGYETRVDYMLRVLIAVERGYQQGEMPMELFDGTYMEQLKSEGRVVTPDFKAQYEGVENIRTMDREVYNNCDKVYFYDVKIEDERVTDLTARAWVCQGIPVLGLGKVDVTLKFKGTPYKAGFDYSKTAILVEEDFDE